MSKLLDFLFLENGLKKIANFFLVLFGIAGGILALDTFIFGFGVYGWMVNDPVGQAISWIVICCGVFSFFFGYGLKKIQTFSLWIFGIAGGILALDTFIFGFGVYGWMVNDPVGQATFGIAFLFALIAMWTGSINDIMNEGLSFHSVWQFLLSTAFFIAIILGIIYS